MDTTADHGVKNPADEEKASSPKRSRSGSPIANITATKDAIISIAEALYPVAVAADAMDKKVRLTLAMRKLWKIRENARFTYATHFEDVNLINAQIKKLEEDKSPDVELFRKRSTISHEAAIKWQEHYADATSLFYDWLAGDIDQKTFDEKLAAAEACRLKCLLLAVPTNEAYAIVCPKVNATWYSDEKTMVKVLGYDPSLLPDN
jgi:hypothetical protein